MDLITIIIFCIVVMVVSLIWIIVLFKLWYTAKQQLYLMDQEIKKADLEGYQRAVKEITEKFQNLYMKISDNNEDKIILTNKEV